jgi:hypothetical protein
MIKYWLPRAVGWLMNDIEFSGRFVLQAKTQQLNANCRPNVAIEKDKLQKHGKKSNDDNLLPFFSVWKLRVAKHGILN